MDYKFTLILILTLFAAATGWQLALWFPPEQFALAGWAVCGLGTLLCLVAAAR